MAIPSFGRTQICSSTCPLPICQISQGNSDPFLQKTSFRKSGLIGDVFSRDFPVSYGWFSSLKQLFLEDLTITAVLVRHFETPLFKMPVEA